jgi:hypothetical protein
MSVNVLCTVFIVWFIALQYVHDAIANGVKHSEVVKHSRTHDKRLGAATQLGESFGGLCSLTAPWSRAASGSYW